jgi:hypothetical protein
MGKKKAEEGEMRDGWDGNGEERGRHSTPNDGIGLWGGAKKSFYFHHFHTQFHPDKMRECSWKDFCELSSLFSIKI